MIQTWLFIVAGVNLLAAVIVLIVLLRKDKQNALATFLFLIAIPVIGFLLLGLASLLAAFRRKNAPEYDFADLMTFQSSKQYSIRPNIKEELDLVSVEESVHISAIQEKRNLVRNILKRDIEKYSRSIRVALKDHDSETAHYAASAIMEVYRKMALGVQRIASAYEEDRDDVEVAAVYLQALWNYISSGILSERDREQSIQKYLAAVQRIRSKDPGLLSQKEYIRMSGLYSENGSLKEAEKWAREALIKYETEDAYLNMLKVAYIMRNKEMFDTVLSDLRKSKVILSDKSVDQLRYWIAG
jgi:tetratricopeptide (TPR) repeat protein